MLASVIWVSGLGRLFAEDAPSMPGLPSQAASGAQIDAIGNSVVKVFGTRRGPDVMKPWTKLDPLEISGSGLVIEGNRILTNAHLVQYVTNLQIQGSQAGDRISAKVETVSQGIDLAVLKLDDESFFATHPPLMRAVGLPRIRDSVLVYGYPTGGESLSITKGIVSRIDFSSYGGTHFGLRMQIDAAINHGNSGGPAMVGDKVIGLACSFLSGAQNIGYIIPNEEIDLMLKRVAAGGAYRGRPMSADAYQSTENPALRRFLHLDPGVQGVVVIKPALDDSAYPIKRWDVVTRIGEVPVDNQGMVKLRDDLQVSMTYLYQGLGDGAFVPVTVIRGGRAESVQLPIATDLPVLFADLEGSYPSYFILGPLVFSRASLQLVALTASLPATTEWLEKHDSPLLTRLGDKPAFPGEDVVVLCPFLASALTVGYRDPALRVVKVVNGTPVRNLLHLVALLRDSKQKFVVIEFADQHVEKFVFRQQELVASTEAIMANNGIRSQGSADTMAEWNRTP